MLVSNDQENMVHCHQLAASKSLNQETKRFQNSTSNNTFSKTPFRIPLQDENVLTNLGRKTGKNTEIENLELGGKVSTKLNRNAFVTPSGPRARAPLGMKTTNLNANVFSKQIGTALKKKEPEKNQTKPTSIRRPKKFTHAGSVKLEIHEDESPLFDREPEYCPPRPKDLPYESDTFPDNCLDYSFIKPENLWKDLKKYQNRQNSSSNIDKEHETAYKKEIRDADEIILKMMEENWTVADVPETFCSQEREDLKKTAQKKPPSISAKPKSTAGNGPKTLTSRRAASALTNVCQPQVNKPLSKLKPQPKSSFYPLSRKRSTPTPISTSQATVVCHVTSTATSKSTIGYTKGRKFPGILQDKNPSERKIKKYFSGVSLGSDTTITPERFTDDDGWHNPRFLKIFDEADNQLTSLSRLTLDCPQEDDEEFLMTLQS